MRRMLASIAAMMLVITLISGFQATPVFAFSMDACNSTIVDDAAPGHSVGDADEVPGDSEKSTPHHHNISHCHEIAVPASEIAAFSYLPAQLPAGSVTTSPPAAAHLYRDLRPPIA